MYQPKTKIEDIKIAVSDMVDELTPDELLLLEDFIVNYCDNSDMLDDKGGYPNLFRMFITNRNGNN